MNRSRTTLALIAAAAVAVLAVAGPLAPLVRAAIGLLLVLVVPGAVAAWRPSFPATA